MFHLEIIIFFPFLRQETLHNVYRARLKFKVGLSHSNKIVFIYFNDSPFKKMKNVFYFMLKALFIPDIFTFLSWIFDYVEKRLDKKAMVNFKIYDVEDWVTNNYNIHINQYLKK